MTTILEALSYENPNLRAYVFWTSILVLKMLLMSHLTGNERKKKKIVPNAEDKKYIGETSEVKYDDPDVERVRRAHRNDLENCLPFMIAGFLYVLTNPSTFIAVNLFRIGVLARIVHTYAYAVSPMQPARGLGFIICFVITAYMSIASAYHFC